MLARDRDRESALVVGRALRGVGLPPGDADPDRRAGQGRTIVAVDDLQLERAVGPGRLRLRLRLLLRSSGRSGDRLRRGPCGSARSRSRASRPAPIAIEASMKAPATFLTVDMIRLLATEPASAAAVAETAPAVAARMVASARASGTAARAPSARIAVSASGATPRFTSRVRSRARPRASRLWSVPSGQESRRAASAYERPSRSQSTTASRYRAGSRATSSSMTSSTSSPSARDAGLTAGSSAIAGGPDRILMRPPPARLGPRPHRHSPGDAVQPRAQPPGVADRPGPLHQDQERRLERVLDVVPVAEDPPADAQHHRTVQRHQRGERRLVVAGREPLEQLAVVQARPPARRGRVARSTSTPQPAGPPCPSLRIRQPERSSLH